jgi:hypothetical protein
MPYQQEEHSLVRKLLPYTTAALIVALLYVGWIFFSRWQLERETQRRAEEKKQEEARRVLEALGSGNVKILAFDANRGLLHPGETAMLCYGVSNAKSVRIEPGIDAKDVWPSMYRCIEIAPRKDTVYTITADDGKGHTETASIKLKVQ